MVDKKIADASYDTFINTDLPAALENIAIDSTITVDTLTVSGVTITGDAATDIATTATKTTEIKTGVDLVNANIGTANTNLGTINTSIGTSNSSLASIKTNTDKIPSLGQALAANSVPVVLTSAQLTTLTPPAAITGFALESGNIATIKDDIALIKAKILRVVSSAGTGTGTGSAQTLSTGTGTYFGISNEGNTSLTFTIGSVTITVGSGDTFADDFSSFSSVSVTAGASQPYNWFVKA